MNRMSTIILFSLVLVATISNLYANKDEQKTLRLATTTSTENSGLLDVLIPLFEKETAYNVHVIAVGTGKALRMGKDGDADVLLVHAKPAEEAFVKNGYGVERIPVMYNDFVIVGPAEDPASLKQAEDIKTALHQIATTQSTFLSRGDDSGTHKKERALWASVAITPRGKWHLEAGQGMGRVLLMSGEIDAYTITDRGTWLSIKDKSPLKIAYEKDKSLYNPYSIIEVNPKRHPHINTEGAKALINWITSESGQRNIGAFRKNNEQLFTPSANTLHTAETDKRIEIKHVN